MRLDSLRLRLVVALCAAALAGALVPVGLTVWPLPQALAGLQRMAGLKGHAPAPFSAAAVCLSVAICLALATWLAGVMTAPLGRLIRALEGMVASYGDGDFSVSLASTRQDELGRLVQMHNALGQALREQRQQLAQRELLLDTVMQHSPVALVLTDAQPGAPARIALANLAARHWLNDGRRMEGSDFDELLRHQPAALRAAVAAGEDTLFTVTLANSAEGGEGDGEETFHLSQRSFQLQGRPHRLRLFRRMTRELSRQEVATWKRVIRVISHELNNSLAPISSLAHSAGELTRRGEAERERVLAVLATIGERARHLHGFLDGYARFAKLPAPRPAAVDWRPFVDGLAVHGLHHVAGPLPAEPGWFDAGQIEQALINLLKNAREAGGAPDHITLAVSLGAHEQRLEVADRGPGMSDAVLAQALLPFYSTKRSGTGLGLALAREIAEAHGGRIALANREGGGLRVVLVLPQGG